MMSSELKSRKGIRVDIWFVTTVFCMLFFIVGLVYPILKIFRLSVINGEGEFTLAYFAKFFGKPYYLKALFNSLKVSVCATLVRCCSWNDHRIYYADNEDCRQRRAGYYHYHYHAFAAVYRCLQLDITFGAERFDHYVDKKSDGHYAAVDLWLPGNAARIYHAAVSAYLFVCLRRFEKYG